MNARSPRYRLQPGLADGRRRHRPSCWSTSRTCARASRSASSSSAARSSTRSRSPRRRQPIDSVANRINGKPAKMIAFCTSFGTDQPAFVDSLRTLRNRPADHQQLGRRRHLLVVEEPEDHELLLRDLRRRHLRLERADGGVGTAGDRGGVGDEVVVRDLRVLRPPVGRRRRPSCS